MSKLLTGALAGVIALPMVASIAFAHDRGGVRQMQAMDANRDAQITRAEAKDFYDDLYRRIASLDGKPGVDADEFARAPEALGKQEQDKRRAIRKKQLEDRFDVVDYDRNGSLSEGEFLDAPTPAIVLREFASAHDHNDKKRKKLFRALDVSGDGEISLDEYLAESSPNDGPRMDAQRERVMQQRRAEFDRLDANDDGLMSRMEYLDVQWKRFDMTDKNKDDILSRDELRDARRDHTSGAGHTSGPTHLLPGIEDLD